MLNKQLREANEYRASKCSFNGRACPVSTRVDTGQAGPQRQQRLQIQPLRKPFITLYNQHFIEVYHFIF